MFEAVSQGLQSALSGILRGGKLTEVNIRDGLKQVKQALLEADVEYNVATSFVERVTTQAVGEQVLKSIRPDQQIVGIVHQELVQLMGPVDHSLHLRRTGLNKIMMCGLQGSGKTTTCGKLARMLRDQGFKPLLVAADLQRPGAIEQLQIIGDQLGVPVYTEPPTSDPVTVCRNGLKHAEKHDITVVIFDTAGRLHIDHELMKQLEQIDNRVQPDQVLLVCDSMTGQDAVKSAKAFNDALELDGVILTKLDGDTRGGAAMSVKAITGVPIKFIGVGETLDKLEPFHPDRMAGRILGMGDVVTLFEKAQQAFDRDELERQQKKMAEGKWNLNDFRGQMKMIRSMGPLRDILKMIPGFGSMLDSAPGLDLEGEVGSVEAIINSMTPAERSNPALIDRSRRHRIARGCGCEPADVSALLKQFEQMAPMMQRMAGMGVRDRFGSMMDMMRGGMMGGDMTVPKQRSKRGPLDERAAKEKKKQARKDAKKQRKRNR